MWTIKSRPKRKTSLKNTQLCVNIFRLRTGSNPFAASIIGGERGTPRVPEPVLRKAKKAKKANKWQTRQKKGKQGINHRGERGTPLGVPVFPVLRKAKKFLKTLRKAKGVSKNNKSIEKGKKVFKKQKKY